MSPQGAEPNSYFRDEGLSSTHINVAATLRVAVMVGLDGMSAPSHGSWLVSAGGPHTQQDDGDAQQGQQWYRLVEEGDAECH